MLYNCHRVGLLSKPYNAVVDRDLWGTDDFTGAELQYGSRTLGATSIKDAALTAVGRCKAFQATLPGSSLLIFATSGFTSKNNFSKYFIRYEV